MWWKYFPLAVMPSIMATFASFIWLLLSPYLKVSTADTEVFNSVFGIVGIAHALIASMQINQGFKQKQKIEVSFSLTDVRMFKENSCVRIDPAIMFLLFIFSLVFFVSFLFYPFETIKAGMVTVWLVVFTLYLLWKIAQELFNIYEGVHKISKEEVVAKFGEQVYLETFGYSELEPAPSVETDSVSLY